MGCGASKRTTVVPVSDSDDNTLSKTGNRRISEVLALQGEDIPAEMLKERALNSSNKNLSRAQPMAFEVPVSTDSLIRKHPPKRLQRLEDQQIALTHQRIDERQAEAEQRRFQILTQRVQSAKQRMPRRHFLDVDGANLNEDTIETIKRENSSVEL